jgi:tRNA(Ile)-lysidine synthase
MWRPDTRVIAAVSGGSDSVAMALLLHELHGAGELRLEAIAHVNHGIRAEAADDERFCRALAARLDVPFVTRQVDVPALAREKKQSLELAGRLARRALLDEVRRDRQADCIATAHTEDDQAETVLLRLLRGTGTRGLAGIAPCGDRRIRPVLCTTRAELRRWLDARGESWCEDVTNADVSHARNRVRHELLPYIEQHFNPSVRRALARAADVVRGEDELLARVAAAATVGITCCDDRGVSMDSRALAALPEAVARRVVMHALAAARMVAPSHDEITSILDVAAGRRAAFDLSCIRAEHFGGKVVLVPRGRVGSSAPSVARSPAPFCLDLPVPGQVRTDSGWVVEATAFDRPQPVEVASDVAQIDAATISEGLMVRNRRVGDRLRPAGLGGTKKLQDVLVDRKVPRGERDALPIVTDKQGRIVWVAGHVLDEEFRVTGRTKGVIILKLRHI